MKIFFFLLVLSLGVSSCGNGQQNDNNKSAMGSMPDSLAAPGVTEYLGAYGPFKIGDYTFHLHWSSHPTENYFKQEYIPQQYFQLDQYIQMVMVELMTGNINAKDAMKAKIKEIEDRKATDKLAKYSTSKDPTTGDEVLEFMLSENMDHDEAIAEWNVYRYVPYKDPSGQKGLELFAYSRRGYGMKTTPFLGEIDRDAAKFKANFLAVPVPVVTMKK